MILTSNKAIELLEASKGMAENDNWINHCICVGNAAGRIAEALNLNVDLAKTLGYIHDIGKRYGYAPEVEPHDMKGYEYITGLGYDEMFASVCLTHSYLNNDIDCVAGGFSNKNGYEYEFRSSFVKKHEYTVYEKIINLCDLMCTTVNMTLEKRLIDIIKRKGVHENTVYHITEAQKLKEWMDEQLGYNVYRLFPEVLDN